MSTSCNTITVRQHASVFVVFFLGGVLFFVFPWYIEAPWWARLFWLALGAVSITVALLGWRSSRIGLVIDRRGVWCGGYSLRGPVLVPWEAILGARKVTLQTPEGPQELLLLGLRDFQDCPVHPRLHEIMRKEFERLLGDIEFANPFIVGHDEWCWNADEVADVIATCVTRPAARELLGEFRSQSDSHHSV